MPGLPPFEAVISQRTLEFDGGKVWPPADRRRITFQGKLTASLKRIFPLEIRQQQYQKLEKENFCLYNCPNIIINKITARWNHHKSFDFRTLSSANFLGSLHISSLKSKSFYEISIFWSTFYNFSSNWVIYSVRFR